MSQDGEVFSGNSDAVWHSGRPAQRRRVETEKAKTVKQNKKEQYTKILKVKEEQKGAARRSSAGSGAFKSRPESVSTDTSDSRSTESTMHEKHIDTLQRIVLTATLSLTLS